MQVVKFADASVDEQGKKNKCEADPRMMEVKRLS